MDSQAQLTAIAKFAKQKLGQDKSGHGFDHLSRVVKMAHRIATAMDQDPFVPVVAAYLHDTIDDKLVDNVDAAKKEVATFLTGLGLTADQVELIMSIISQISFASTLDGNRPALPLAGQIVQDADWLDAIGAIGITRAIYYGGKHHQVIYDPAMPPRENLTKDEYRNLDHETIINHFHEKLLKLAGMLNTPVAKEIAAHRQQVMLDFLAEFDAEWQAQR